jgi:hypothetical protein
VDPHCLDHHGVRALVLAAHELDLGPAQQRAEAPVARAPPLHVGRLVALLGAPVGVDRLPPPAVGRQAVRRDERLLDGVVEHPPPHARVVGRRLQHDADAGRALEQLVDGAVLLRRPLVAARRLEAARHVDVLGDRAVAGRLQLLARAGERRVPAQHVEVLGRGRVPAPLRLVLPRLLVALLGTHARCAK